MSCQLEKSKDSEHTGKRYVAYDNKELLSVPEKRIRQLQNEHNEHGNDTECVYNVEHRPKESELAWATNKPEMIKLCMNT